MNGTPAIAGHETELAGAWLERKGSILADPVARRIEQLIDQHLVELGADPSGWEVLYRDPDDGRLWELTWPQAEMQGGGPPRLACLAIEAARSKYGAMVDI
jgi:hypothetical protein